LHEMCVSVCLCYLARAEMRKHACRGNQCPWACIHITCLFVKMHHGQCSVRTKVLSWCCIFVPVLHWPGVAHLLRLSSVSASALQSFWSLSMKVLSTVVALSMSLAASNGKSDDELLLQLSRKYLRTNGSSGRRQRSCTLEVSYPEISDSHSPISTPPNILLQDSMSQASVLTRRSKSRTPSHGQLSRSECRSVTVTSYEPRRGGGSSCGGGNLRSPFAARS
jgi:hypothetical protein